MVYLACGWHKCGDVVDRLRFRLFHYSKHLCPVGEVCAVECNVPSEVVRQPTLRDEVQNGYILTVCYEQAGKLLTYHTGAAGYQASSH